MNPLKLATVSLVTALFTQIVSADEIPASVFSGGQTSKDITGPQSYSLPSGNMSLIRRMDFSVGNSFFRNPWVQAPASTDARDGLGPLFNTNGCQNCHIKDGRGNAPDPLADHQVSMLIRLSIENDEVNAQRKEHQAVIPEPTYGGQLQDFAVPGLQPEGKIEVRYASKTITFKDGYIVELREPEFEISNLANGPLHKDIKTSARVAPGMIGLGLLELISDQQMNAIADPEDKNGDGISGKIQKVWDVRQQKMVTGKFGWKAGQPNVMQQNAGAFNGDLGVTSNLFPAGDCTSAQTDCLKAPHGGDPEVSDSILGFVELYARNLAVPIRRNYSAPEVIKGDTLFSELNCDACHVRSYQLSQSDELPEQSGQLIFPYTDLLLHDMGEDLADGRKEYSANGNEWRTPALWGIGLTQEVNPKAGFLHDGRARTLEEAVLWHGGEAQSSNSAYQALSAQDRKALIAFLESL